MGDNEILYEVKPTFNFLYELTMPSGKKMKKSFLTLLIFVILDILLSVLKNYLVKVGNFSDSVSAVYDLVKTIMLILIVFFAIVFVVRLVLQLLEYKGISYKFTSKSMYYENSFLRQTKKTIEYANIKEVEIRKSILDRILNYGIVVIYTNAEKGYGGATVLYAIKDAQDVYENIESLIHTGKVKDEAIKMEDDNKKEENSSFKVGDTSKQEYGDLNSNSDVNPVNENEDNKD